MLEKRYEFSRNKKLIKINKERWGKSYEEKGYEISKRRGFTTGG